MSTTLLLADLVRQAALEGKPVSAAKVARRFGADKTRCEELLTALERAGLLRRFYVLTPKGPACHTSSSKGIRVDSR